MRAPGPGGDAGAEQVECREAALRILGRRERTRRSLGQVLRRREFSPSVIEAVVDQLSAQGLVDDRRCGRLLLEHHVRLQPTSTRSLEARLRREGCDGATIEEVFQYARAHVDEFDDLALARRVVEKKLRTRSADRDKILGVLARQGFTRSVAWAAWTAATAAGSRKEEE